MLRNHFFVALRTLWKNKVSTITSLLGLTLGIGCGSLLLYHVVYENSYDSFHSNYKSIVRPITIQTDADSEREFGWSPNALAHSLWSESANVKSYTILTRFYRFDIKIEDRRFSETNYFITDSSFLDVFDFELIAGDRESALLNPYSMVVTESQATKFFGHTDVVGQVVEVVETGSFKVTGVLKDIPSNSHLDFDFLVSYHEPIQSWRDYTTTWSSYNSNSYLLLEEGVKANEFQKEARRIWLKSLPKQFESRMDFKFQPLADIHLESQRTERDFSHNKGDKGQLKIYVLVAIFLLLISTVNFVNLFSSVAMTRAKEIGVRKVIGASKFQLATQFLTESFMVTLAAFILSIGFIDVFGKQFSAIGIDMGYSTGILGYLPMMLIVAIVVGLIAGIYPSLIVSAFKPVEALKGRRGGISSFRFRSLFVVVQFVVSIVLIIATLVVSQQVSYLQNRPLGFSSEDLLVIDINDRNVVFSFRAMRNELEQIPGVQSVGVSSRVPGEWKVIDEVMANVPSSSRKLSESTSMFYMGFDEKMLNTFKIELIEGENFTGNDERDANKILINETAQKALDLTEAIGTSVNISRRQLRREKWEGGTYKIVGVVKDFNFESLHVPVAPLIIGTWNHPASIIDYFTLRVDGDLEETIVEIKKVHEKFDQRSALEYHVLDDQLQNFYAADNKSGQIFQLGAVISIIVACIGLFGLATFITQLRSKEIGIRKVLGASISGIFFLLSKGFIRQVAVAFLIATPVAMVMMRNWLVHYAYRVPITPSIFIIAALAALVMVFLAISYKSMLAARSNPIDELKNE